MQLFIENLKMNRKRTKKFYLPGQGFEPQIFSNFPAHDLISCKVRVTISNKNKFPKEIGLYLETTNVIWIGGLCQFCRASRYFGFRSNWIQTAIMAEKHQKYQTWSKNMQTMT